MTTPKSALITVAHNSAADLERHWSGARELGVEWIVVDNASTDDSASVAERLGATVIRLDRNSGFSAANNIAAEATDADCLIFVNPDVSCDAEGVRVLATEAKLQHALVAPQLLNGDGSTQENGRRMPYLYRKLLHFFGSRLSHAEYEVVADPGVIAQVSWVIGAAVAIPRSVFREIGGWDSTFFIYYEDSDICIRARRAGYRTLLHGDVRWTHGWARATRRSLSWRAWKFELASALKFYARYPRLLLHPRVTRGWLD